MKLSGRLLKALHPSHRQGMDQLLAEELRASDGDRAVEEAHWTDGPRGVAAPAELLVES